MTFLNPLILTGLLAISIPIIIHLLNLSKVRKVEFSTLRFLKELQKSKMKRIKLRQLLLLALRIMTIIFLVLAFADPVLKSSSGNYAGKSSAVVILDNSFSMSAEDNKIFENAKTAAKDVVTSLDADDEIYFILSSDLGSETAKLISSDQVSIRTRIDSAAISLKPFSINEGIINASLLFANSSYTVRDLFVISDFQMSNFDDLSKFVKNENAVDFNVYLVNSGEDELYNISLDSAGISSGMAASGMDTKARARINNISPYSQKSRSIRLMVDGSYTGESFADIGSFEKQTVEQSFRISKPGSLSCEFLLDKGSMEDDQLIQDNKAHFVSVVPSSIKVALIGVESGGAGFTGIALETAEQLTGNTTEDSKGFYDIVRSQSIEESVMDQDVLIISGLNDLSDNEAKLLNDYVSNGGGILIFPGDDMNVNSINDKLLSRSGGLRLGNRVSMEEQETRNFGKIDFDHPLLSGVFRNRSLSITTGSGSIESPKIRQYYKTLLSESGKGIILLDNNDPMISEIRQGKGKILFSSVSLTQAAGDFPSKSIFVPILVRAVNYLSGNISSEDQYYVGSRNIVKTIGLNNVRTILNPSGRIDSMSVIFGEGKEKYFILPYSSETSFAGVYKASDSSGNEFLFALNPNPIESDLRVIPEKEAREYFSGRGFANVFYSSWDDVRSSYASSKQGSQLWKYFLILALLMLVAEKFLSRKLEKGE